MEWWRGGRERGKFFYNPMITSQSFSESLPKAGAFMSVSQFILFSLHLGGMWRTEEAESWALPLLPVNSVQFSSVMCNSLQPHGLQHARLPCLSSTPRAYSNSCPSSQWCHATISSFVIPFFSCLQSFPASGSFPMSQFFASDGQSIGVSASTSVLWINIQGWFLLGLTGWISLQSKRLSRVFSNTTGQKHQFFGTQLSLWSNSHIHTWLLGKP